MADLILRTHVEGVELFETWHDNGDGTYSRALYTGASTAPASVRAVTLQNAAAAIGTGTPLDVSGMSTLVAAVSGTFVATVTYEGSVDDATWFPLMGELISTTIGTLVLTSTTAVAIRFVVAGLKSVRARISAWTSGAVTVVARAQANEGPMPQTNVALYAAGTTTSLASGPPSDAITTGSPLWSLIFGMGFNGGTWDRLRVATIFKPVALVAGTAETAIWTPGAGKKFRLMGFLLTCGAASTLTIKDGTGGTTILAARGGLDVPIPSPGMGNGILSSAANALLTITRGTSCTLDGFVFGTEE